MVNSMPMFQSHIHPYSSDVCLKCYTKLLGWLGCKIWTFYINTYDIWYEPSVDSQHSPIMLDTCCPISAEQYIASSASASSSSSSIIVFYRRDLQYILLLPILSPKRNGSKSQQPQPQPTPAIWVHDHSSLTWILRPFWDDSPYICISYKHLPSGKLT